VARITRTGNATVDLEFERPAADEVEVDAETLDAIDRAIEAAKAGRSVSLDELRKKIPEWISKFESRNPR
jgi:predicted transcriptional regulator